MKFSEYLKEESSKVILVCFSLLLIINLLLIFHIHFLIIITIAIIILTTYLVIFLINYFKRKEFYNHFFKTLNHLDQKCLITEIIKEPNFIEGKKLLEILYEINKSYLENINYYQNSFINFEEYINLWCHEIKTPIATSKLIMENNPNKTTNSIKEEMDKIESLIEQVLYYAKTETVNEDYQISSLSLKKLVQEVIRQNQKTILHKKLKINLFEDDVTIKSDSKWLSFIINQIIINSIKYTNAKGKISITVTRNDNNTILNIWDNGIGIKEEEQEDVFKKGFTGSNGRKIASSTGMGLYLVNKLIHALGHEIKISSEENTYTNVSLIFPDDSYINLK